MKINPYGFLRRFLMSRAAGPSPGPTGSPVASELGTERLRLLADTAVQWEREGRAAWRKAEQMKRKLYYEAKGVELPEDVIFQAGDGSYWRLQVRVDLHVITKQEILGGE